MIDQVSIKRFKARKDNYLQELEKDLQKGRYRPDLIRRVYIPKGKGQTRPLGIPTVKDRVVQAALKIVLEPIFEREFTGQDSPENEKNTRHKCREDN